MKTTNNKVYHVGLRLDEDALNILDGLCSDAGGASHSRLLRSLLLWLKSDPSDTYRNYDGTPCEENRHRREFLRHLRGSDDAMIASMTDAIAGAVRRR